MSLERKFAVAIVEDNSQLGESLREIVDSSDSLRCVAVWPTAEEAIEKVDSVRPQVILMDINLPGMSGIEATAAIREKLPAIQIVMVTVYGDHDQIFAALKAGAAGYLLKCSSPAEVRASIHDVLTGGAPMSPEIARRVVEAFHIPQTKPADTLNLSPRETEVLELLAEGLANKELADRLNISVETIRVHLRNIYEKLHVRSRTEAALKFLNARKTGP